MLNSGQEIDMCIVRAWGLDSGTSAQGRVCECSGLRACKI